MAGRPNVSWGDAWERSKDAASRTRKDLSEKAAVVPVGLSNIPIDIGKYAELGANKFKGWLHNRPAPYTRMDAERIDEEYQSPAMYPEEINSYRNYITDKYPVATGLAEASAGGLFKGAATAVPKAIKEVSKLIPKYKGIPNPRAMANRVNKQFITKGDMALGTGVGLANEFIKEKGYDQLYLGN